MDEIENVSESQVLNQEEEEDGEAINNYRGLYFGDDEEQKYYEAGAHFSYQALFLKLSSLAKSISPGKVEKKGHSLHDAEYSTHGGSSKTKADSGKYALDIKDHATNIMQNHLTVNKHQRNLQPNKDLLGKQSTILKNSTIITNNALNKQKSNSVMTKNKEIFPTGNNNYPSSSLLEKKPISTNQIFKGKDSLRDQGLLKKEPSFVNNNLNATKPKTHNTNNTLTNYKFSPSKVQDKRQGSHDNDEREKEKERDNLRLSKVNIVSQSKDSTSPLFKVSNSNNTDKMKNTSQTRYSAGGNAQQGLTNPLQHNNGNPVNTLTLGLTNSIVYVAAAPGPNQAIKSRNLANNIHSGDSQANSLQQDKKKPSTIIQDTKKKTLQVSMNDSKSRNQKMQQTDLSLANIMKSNSSVNNKHVVSSYKENISNKSRNTNRMLTEKDGSKSSKNNTVDKPSISSLEKFSIASNKQKEKEEKEKGIALGNHQDQGNSGHQNLNTVNKVLALKEKDKIDMVEKIASSRNGSNTNSNRFNKIFNTLNKPSISTINSSVNKIKKPLTSNSNKEKEKSTVYNPGATLGSKILTQANNTLLNTQINDTKEARLDTKNNQTIDHSRANERVSSEGAVAANPHPPPSKSSLFNQGNPPPQTNSKARTPLQPSNNINSSSKKPNSLGLASKIGLNLNLNPHTRNVNSIISESKTQMNNIANLTSTNKNSSNSPIKVLSVFKNKNMVNNLDKPVLINNAGAGTTIQDKKLIRSGKSGNKVIHSDTPSTKQDSKILTGTGFLHKAGVNTNTHLKSTGFVKLGK